VLGTIIAVSIAERGSGFTRPLLKLLLPRTGPVIPHRVKA